MAKADDLVDQTGGATNYVHAGARKLTTEDFRKMKNKKGEKCFPNPEGIKVTKSYTNKKNDDKKKDTIQLWRQE
jgi:hypothetical protein